MRTLFLTGAVIAALTIGVSPGWAEHAGRPARPCVPTYSTYRGVSVGYPAYSVRPYQNYRLSPAYTARHHLYRHHVHHLYRPARYYPSNPGLVHHYGYSPYGNAANVGVPTGGFGLYLGF